MVLKLAPIGSMERQLTKNDEVPSMSRPRLSRALSFLSKAAPPEPPAAVTTADCQVITAEVDAIKQQVEQARQLLADAIVKLGDSFTRLEADTSVQRTVMDNLLANLSWSRSGGDGSADGKNDVSIRQFAAETTAVLRQFTELLASVSGQSIKTVYRIDDMAQELEEIFKLVANINEIASETFMLAVNATIAAAHAGPAGRAFSVIAGNVRELSKKTRRFNDQIGFQIGKAQTTVNEVRLIIGQMASRDLNVALASKERVQSMLADVERLEQAVLTSVEQSNAATGRIAASTSTAITALQFEDIMSQLMATIARRADRIAQATSTPEGTSAVSVAEREGPVLPTPTAPGKVADPVQQRNMNAGEVELF